MLAGMLQRFLDKHGVQYTEGKRAFITSCLNPTCGKEDHCYIWKSDAGAVCFRCGCNWRWKKVVSLISGCSYRDSYEVFFGQGAGDSIVSGIDVNTLFPHEIEEHDDNPLVPVLIGPDFISARDSQRALEYLASRGIVNGRLIVDYDLRYNAAMDAIVFPIIKDGKNYGWQARRVDPKENELRLISQQSFLKSKFLLNYDRAKKYKRIVVVEGPFDCLHCEDYEKGITGVASLGKNISSDQIKLILDLPSPQIYLGLDPDASEEVYEVVRRIGLGKSLYRIWPPRHRKDFGECTREEMLESVLSAVPVTAQSDFLDVYFK